jgi:hypothetical protein
MKETAFGIYTSEGVVNIPAAASRCKNVKSKCAIRAVFDSLECVWYSEKDKMYSARGMNEISKKRVEEMVGTICLVCHKDFMKS